MSCDVYFYNLGHRLGIDRISEIAKSFGFGSPTGVDLPYEKSGLVPSEEWAIEKRQARWYPSETISVSIGQGPVLVTTAPAGARPLGGRSRTAAFRRRISSSPRRSRTAAAGCATTPRRRRACCSIPRSSTRQERHVGGHERAGRHRVRLARAGRRGRRQDRDRRRSSATTARFGRARTARSCRTTRGSSGSRPSTTRRSSSRLRRERRPREPGRRAAREAPLREEVRQGGRRAPLSPQQRGRRVPSRRSPGVSRRSADPPGRSERTPMIRRVAAVPRRLDLDRPRLRGVARRSSESSSSRRRRRGGRLAGLATRQAIWVGVGLAGLAAAVLFDYRTLLKISFPLYCASLVPLVYLLVFGQRIANVKSWIRFGSFQFQPAELAKIATALLVAYLFENEDDGRLRLSAFVKLGAIVGVPFLLVFLQPDLGLALTFLAAARDRPLLRRASAQGLDRDLPRRRDLRGRGLVLPEGLPEAADLDVLQSRPGRPEGRLPGAAVEDRGGLRRVFREGVPVGHAEPAPLPARPAHRLHLRRHRRGVGVPRRHPRPRPLRRRSSCAR